MKNDKFENLKKQLNKEYYGNIKFSKDEKDRVMMAVKTTDKPKKPAFFKVSMSIAAVVTLLVFGSMILTQGLDSTEKAEQQENDPNSEKLAANDQDAEASESVNAGGDGLSKEWKDVTKPEDVPPTHPTSAKDLIAHYNEVINGPLDEVQKDEPVYYDAMGAGNLRFSLFGITVEGEAIERDFENLKNLCIMIHMEEQKRYEHLDLPKGEWPQAHLDKWKEPSEKMVTAIAYMKGLLNDLDIAINDNTNLEPSGYAHMLDGEKVEELEAFIPPEDELVDVKIVKDW